MKKIHLLTLVLFLLLCKQTSYAQVHQVDSLPVYNLFYLSKYITASNLSKNDSLKVYNSLMSLIQSSKNNQYIFENEKIKSLILEQENEMVSKVKSTFKQCSTISSLPEIYKNKLNNDDALKLKLEVFYNKETKLKKTNADIITKKGELYKYFEFLKAESNKTENLEIGTVIKEFNKLSEDQKEVFSNSNISLLTLTDFQNQWNSINSNPDAINTSKKEDLIVKFKILINSVSIGSAIETFRKDDLFKLNSDLTNNDKDLDIIATEFFQRFDKNATFSDQIRLQAVSHSAPTVQQIQITSVLQSAEQQSVSGFKLPSEADLINAVAVFLANRAKQEAIIWFIDKLKEEMHNPFVFDAFPNTFALLRQTESYNTPNFGQTWRYALSQDFVRMPDNLLNSPWLEKIWGEKSKKNLSQTKEMLKIGTAIYQLVQAQYNYRDIIRYIHLNGESQFKEPQIRSYFDFLYMLINELYAVEYNNNIASYRLLSYEELSTLNLTQLQVFLELIKIKYPEGVFEMLDEMIMVNESQLKNFNQIGVILLTLSQFDKIRHSNTNVSDETNSSTSLWSNLKKIIDQFDSTFFINDSQESERQKLNAKITDFKRILSIYENVQSNRFDLVAKDLVVLLDGVIRTGYSDPNGYTLFYDSGKKEILLNDKKIVTLSKSNQFKDFELSYKPGLITIVYPQNGYNWKKINEEYKKFTSEADRVKIINPFIDSISNLKNDSDKIKLFDAISSIINSQKNKGRFKISFNEDNCVIKGENNKSDSSFVLPSKVNKVRLGLYKEQLVLLDTMNFNLNTLKSELQLLNYLTAKTNIDDWNSITNKMLDSNSVSYKLLKKIRSEIKEGDYESFHTLKLAIDLLDMRSSGNLPSSQHIANTLHHISLNDDYVGKYGNKLIKLTSFFSEVFYASDSKSLAAAIDRHALPPTSYTLKRKVPFSVTFNGYVGFYSGIQKVFSSHSKFIKVDANSRSITSSFAYGITAPIGFTFSKQGGGVFLQLIDVGNLVGHYLWQKNVEEERPNITFKEVISPGINFMYYLNRSPFALFGGIKGIPLEEERDENNVLLNNAIFDIIQFTGGIKIDIPLFNIYKK